MHLHDARGRRLAAANQRLDAENQALAARLDDVEATNRRLTRRCADLEQQLRNTREQSNPRPRLPTETTEFQKQLRIRDETIQRLNNQLATLQRANELHYEATYDRNTPATEPNPAA